MQHGRDMDSSGINSLEDMVGKRDNGAPGPGTRGECRNKSCQPMAFTTMTSMSSVSTSTKPQMRWRTATIDASFWSVGAPTSSILNDDKQHRDDELGADELAADA
jgi:TRAP-type uncharacterized transport system substrate-binding protein